MCTEYLSCRIAAHRGPLTVEMVEHEGTAPNRSWFEVVAEPGVLGSVSVKRLTAWDGRELAYFDAFGGGNCLGQFRSLADATAEVVRNARRSSGGWVMALHG